MTEEQADAIRDALIAEQNAGPSPLAVKFDSWLLAACTDVASEQADLDKITAECRTAILAENGKFITNLKAELANDPDKRGYAGMTEDQIVAEMAMERDILETRPGPAAMPALVQGVIDTLSVPPAGLAVGPDGTVLTDGLSGLQALIDKAIDASGKTRDELCAPTSVQVVTGISAAPFWRVSSGVQYSRNVIRVDEIRAARS